MNSSFRDLKNQAGVVKIPMALSRQIGVRMLNQSRILVYGRDPSLLETRQLVLETIGGKVNATTELKCAERFLTQGPLNLLVLCYTLSSEDRGVILALAQRLHPNLNVLVLRADGPASTETADGDFSIFGGPAALKAKVMEMLGRGEFVHQAQIG
jgi:hypothetical protein